MQGKLRSINTKFWDDPYIRQKNNNEKLLYLYLLTNSLTNMAGIYEITIDRMSFDTGVKKEIIKKALEGFQRDNKIYFIDNYIILKNFMKNQNYNTNMQKSIENTVDNLPDSVKHCIFNDLTKASEDFLTIRKAFVNMKLNLNKNLNKNLNLKNEEKIEAPEEELNYQGIIEHWNSIFNDTKISLIKTITGSRLEKLKTRLKEKEFDFKQICEEIAISNFLNGENDRNWTPDFDWIVKNSTNYIKILEKKYD